MHSFDTERLVHPGLCHNSGVVVGVAGQNVFV